MNRTKESKEVNFDVFWGEIAPCDHLLQIYENDLVFLDSLEGFVAGGLNAEESVIVIGTANHLMQLETRLTSQGFNVAELQFQDKYIPLEAEETLSRFMIEGWPNEELFNTLVAGLLLRARKAGRRVRAFGEMVAVLWAQGNNGATVHLEHLWNQFCAQDNFSLFCAYPKSGFTEDAKDSLIHICNAHTKLVNGSSRTTSKLYFSEIMSGLVNDRNS